MLCLNRSTFSHPINLPTKVILGVARTFLVVAAEETPVEVTGLVVVVVLVAAVVAVPDVLVVVVEVPDPVVEISTGSEDGMFLPSRVCSLTTWNTGACCSKVSQYNARFTSDNLLCIGHENVISVVSMCDDKPNEFYQC
jgi:hypothetical protein